MRKPPAYLNDYLCQHIEGESPLAELDLTRLDGPTSVFSKTKLTNKKQNWKKEIVNRRWCRKFSTEKGNCWQTQQTPIPRKDNYEETAMWGWEIHAGRWQFQNQRPLANIPSCLPLTKIMMVSYSEKSGRVTRRLMKPLQWAPPTETGSWWLWRGIFLALRQLHLQPKLGMHAALSTLISLLAP